MTIRIRSLLLSFVMPGRLLVQHRALVKLLIHREMVARTSGTVLGWTWMVVQPALQIFGMWFLMDVVLKVRSPGRVPFLHYFLVGIVGWTLINEILQRSLTVMVEFGSLYQRTVFPLPLLPLLPIVVSGFIYGTVIAIVSTLLEGPHAALGAILFTLCVMILLVPFAYLWAVMGLFIRESRQVVPFALTLLLYVTPILYMPEQMPSLARQWSVVNPVADIMVLLHAVIQDMPWEIGNLLRPTALWMVLTPLAWKLFKRTEMHMREAL